MNAIHFKIHEPAAGGLSRMRARLHSRPHASMGRKPLAMGLVAAVFVLMLAIYPAWFHVAPPSPGVGQSPAASANAHRSAKAPARIVMVQTRNVRGYWLAPPVTEAGAITPGLGSESPTLSSPAHD